MRLSVALLLAASLVAAHPQGVGLSAHNGLAKRLKNRAEPEIVPLALRFKGDHDLDDVPDGLEYPGDDGPEDSSLYGSGPEEFDDEHVLDPSDNSTTPVVSDRDIDEMFERGTYRKVGIPWTNEVPRGLKQFQHKNMFGMYTWTEWCPTEAKTYGIRCFPMLKSAAKKDKFKNTVKAGYGGGGWVMGPNEVNLASQSKMSPGQAKWLFEVYLLPLKKKGFKVLGPSTANGKTAIDWYKSFRKTAPGVWNQLDALAVHYYGTDPKKVIDYLKQWHTTFGKDIWLTEIGCQSYSRQPQCSQGQANYYMKEITQFCESQGWCKSYFWYSTFVNSRVGVNKVNAMFSSSSGSLTAFGKALLSS